MNGQTLALSIALAAGATLLPTAALAQAPGGQDSPKKDDTALARSLYEEGVREMDAGRYPEAAKKLEAATGLVPKGIGGKLTLGDVYRKMGRLASAWHQYTAAEKLATEAGDAARAKDAQSRAAAIKPLVATLTIRVSKALRDLPGLRIKHGDTALDPSQPDISVPVDPGDTTVTVGAPGYIPAIVTVKVAQNGARIIAEIPMLDKFTRDGAAEGKRTPAPGAPGTPSPNAVFTTIRDGSKPLSPDRAAAAMFNDRRATRESSAPRGAAALPSSGDTASPLSDALRGFQRPLGLGATGLGLLGLGAGTAMGILALTQNDASRSNGHCTALGACDDTGYALRLQARTTGDVATVALMAGGVLTAGGLTLILTAPGAASSLNGGGDKTGPSPRKGTLPLAFVGVGLGSATFHTEF